MGVLIDGEWHDKWYDTESTGGHFERSETRWRNWITADGAPGPAGDGGFGRDSGRYHLYVSDACRWAHRALILRMIKGLAPYIFLGRSSGDVVGGLGISDRLPRRHW